MKWLWLLVDRVRVSRFSVPKEKSRYGRFTVQDCTDDGWAALTHLTLSMLGHVIQLWLTGLPDCGRGPIPHQEPTLGFPNIASSPTPTSFNFCEPRFQ